MTPELACARSLYDALARAMTERVGGTGLAGLRRTYDSWFDQFPIPPDAQVLPVDAGSVPALQVRSPGASAARTVIHLHSGGYVLGSARSYRAMGAALSRAADATVILLNYRLAPEHPYPAALEDALDAYRWVLAGGAPAATVVLCGDSAGGGLVMATLVRLREQGAPMPAAVVAISPFADLALTGNSLRDNRSRDPICQPDALGLFARLYLGGVDARAPLASPLYADLTGLPPLLIIAGEAETLRDDAIRLADRAHAAGVPVDVDIVAEMPHIFPVFASFLPEAQLAISKAGEFVRTHTLS